MSGSSQVRHFAMVGVWVVVALPLSAGAQESGLAEGAMDAPAGAGDYCKCLGEPNFPSVDRIEDALRSPLRSPGFEFADTPLVVVVSFLQEDYDIPVQLDTPALDEIGLGPDEPVTIHLHKISLRSALRLMLKQLQLTYIIQDEVLMITTPHVAKSELTTCVYDVRDLSVDAADKTNKALIDAITSCVATETWAVHGGGEAEIRSLQPGILVISQMHAVHEQIRGLLSAIRDVRRERPAPDGAAGDPVPADAVPVVTRSYLLQVDRSNEPSRFHNQVLDFIMQSMPEVRWNGKLADGQAVVLTVMPDRVVVRHRQSVQDELRALLVDSGIAAPANGSEMSARGMGGGGGGFFRPDPARDD